ncbi:MAG: glycoside hydrolase family 2 TIM barrel-domain containing protein [Planctomycetota bacterium]
MNTSLGRLSTIAASVITSAAAAQGAADNPANLLCSSEAPVPHWNNLEVININRADARAFFFPFPTEEAAADNALPAEYMNSPWVKSLNGRWDYHWAANPDETPAGFMGTDFTASGDDWSTIPVPANIEMQGHGFPNYTNIRYHFSPAEPPNVPADQNWVSSYRRTFDVPSSWDGMRHTLRFEGVGSAIELWVNGRYIGYAEDGRSSIEFDITDATTTGKNVIAAKVFRLSNGSYLECQDFWRLSGMYRDVLVWAAPATTIEDITVNTELDGPNGKLTIQPTIATHASLEGAATADITATLRDNAGNIIAKMEQAGLAIAADASSTSRMQIKVPDIQPWTAETPNLYTLTVTLDADGSTSSVPLRVGFREIDIAEGVYRINGNPVLIRGVNRHEHEPDTAHAITFEGMVRDIEIMKQHNFNAVRTAHYPNHPVFYQLCDEHGLYVVDEANVESHGIGYDPDKTLANKPEWIDAHVERFQRMVKRDRNFTSIVAWSLGNEMGDGVGTSAAYAWGNEYDPTRPIQSERAQWVNGNTDIVVPMYASPQRIERYATTDNIEKPLILCEYSHAMGNSNGNFDWYWDIFRSQPKLGGGFIWDWCDQGLSAKSPPKLALNLALPNATASFVGRASPDGAQGYAILDQPGMPDLTGPLTLEAWVKTEEVAGGGAGRSGHGQIIGKGDEQASLKLTNDHVEFFIHVDGTWHVARAAKGQDWFGNWQHLAGTFDGNNVILYINGRRVASATTNNLSPSSTPFPLSIGTNSQIPGREFEGLIREVRIYDRPLSETEVRQTGAEPNGLTLHARPNNETISAIPGTGGEPFFAYGGFFEPAGTYNDDNFCMNGVVNADRRPKPAMAAIKWNQRPVTAELIDAESRRVRITSWYDHADIANKLVGEWRLLEDGVEIASGDMDVPSLAPRSTAIVEIDAPRTLPAPGRELHLDLRWRTATATAAVPAGHEVAWEQFHLATTPADPIVRNAGDVGQIIDDGTGRTFTATAGNGFAATFDRTTGAIVSLSHNDRELLEAPLVPYFWRAPIDNDRGNRQPARAAAWRNAGDSWTINSIKTATSPGRAVITATGTLRDVGADYTVTYTVRPSGEVHVQADMGRPREGVGLIPRFGMRTQLARDLTNITWFGPGPDESYWDRDELPLGQWTTTVADSAFPYSEPQETGNRVRTRWMTVTDNASRGLMILADPDGCSVPDQALSIAAVPFDTHEAGPAKYWHDVDLDRVFLHIDTAQTGVGGDNSWGATPKARYILRSAPQRVAFVLRPINNADEATARRGISP